MKTNNKYRFSLQWQKDTEEKTKAGDFLESLGNKKSELVVAAVFEYLCRHPEVAAERGRFQVVVQANYTKEHLMVMIQEAISSSGILTSENQKPDPLSKESIGEGEQPSFVEAMLGNLTAFDV